VPNASLTVWDASSSVLTLRLMLLAAAGFLPLIILYTGWVYRVLRGRITIESMRAGHGHY
jgi:cytochrome d ubiquinol oxidase subunit II